MTVEALVVLTPLTTNVPESATRLPPRLAPPDKVNELLPVLVKPPAPETKPEDVPSEIVAVLVAAIASAPPLRVVMVALPLAVNEPPDMAARVALPPAVNEPRESVFTFAAPVMLAVPPEIFAAVVWPRVPAVTAPPEIALFNAPVTATVPSEIPPVIVALLPKEVEPAPDKVETLTVPDPPLKFTVPALDKAPTL